MATITANVSASATTWPVSAEVDIGFYTIDSENVYVTGSSRGATGRAFDRLFVSVDRAVGGSTTASHSSGATLTRYYPDAASAGGGAPDAHAASHEDGGADEIDLTGLPGAGTSFPVVLTVGNEENADLSLTATATNDGIANSRVARVDRTVEATGVNEADANTTVTAVDGQAAANVTVTITGEGEAQATTTVTTGVDGGVANITRTAIALGAGNAVASTTADSEDGQAEVSRTADSTTWRAKANTTVTGGSNSEANTDVTATSGTASVQNIARTTGGTGLATASVKAVNDVRSAGLVVVADTTSARMGFYNATPVVKPTGVAVTAEGIHAALVSLGLIEA